MVSKEEAFSYWKYLCASEKTSMASQKHETCLKRSSDVRFIFTKNFKLLGRQFPERCDGRGEMG